MQSPVGARVIIEGREYDYFSGTGYLGLQTHPEVVQAAVEALQRYGFSTGSPRGGYGEHDLYDCLEGEICAFLGVEKALSFASGYLGIPSLTQATGHLYEHIFIDSAAHYSLWDAAQAANRPLTPFRHRSAEHLGQLLGRELAPGERPLVLTDGVFPVSGAIAPLNEYLPLVEPYQGRVYVDDAHALGVLGPHGRGTCDHYGISSPSCASSATLSKALGGFGGIIGGAAKWIDQIDRNSPILTGASPLPLPAAAASSKALAIARTQPELRQRLWENASQARSGLRALGWDLEETTVPIICLGARPGLSLPRIRRELFRQGIAVTHVRNYTSAPPGGALRIAIFATHTTAQINRLVATIAKLIG